MTFQPLWSLGWVGGWRRVHTAAYRKMHIDRSYPHIVMHKITILFLHFAIYIYQYVIPSFNSCNVLLMICIDYHCTSLSARLCCSSRRSTLSVAEQAVTSRRHIKMLPPLCLWDRSLAAAASRQSAFLHPQGWQRATTWWKLTRCKRRSEVTSVCFDSLCVNYDHVLFVRFRNRCVIKNKRIAAHTLTSLAS